MKFRPQVLGPAIVAAAGVGMLIWSWGTWPDPIVDFGREIYVPWQLSQGKVLYRDIVSYFNGPLSPYLHALLFRIFGASLRALVIFNLLVVAGVTTLIYRLIAQAADQLSATVAAVSFLTLFAFAQIVVTGNYNFVTPYSYELPHGIALSLAAIATMARWHATRKRLWLCLTGALLGLVLLTKAEIALAIAITLAAGAGASPWVHRSSVRRGLADVAIMLACAALVDGLAALLLLIRLPPGQALRGMLGAWRWVGDRTLLQLPYFQELAGTDDVAASLLRMLIWFGAYAVVLGFPVVAARLLRQRGLAGGIFVLLALAGWWMRGLIHWEHVIAPLPLLILLAAIVTAIRLIRRRDNGILPFALCVWALAMLARMPLNPHIYHYGFALAMPATMVGIALLVGWMPRWLDRWNVGNAMRAATLAGLAVASGVYLTRMHDFWSHKTLWVGAGGDAYRADARGEVINATLAEFKRAAPRGGTLAVVPEGLIINYLARMENPTGQLNFTPPAVIMYGEPEMIRAFEAHPPDFVLLSGVDTAEYGARFFGDDYARSLGQWIQDHYTVERVIGARPFQDQGFGIVILRRSTSAN